MTSDHLGIAFSIFNNSFLTFSHIFSHLHRFFMVFLIFSATSFHIFSTSEVVVGDTASTETRLCRFGFRAAPGWDPATGLGVPRFSVLRELLPNLGRKNTRWDTTYTHFVENYSIYIVYYSIL